MAEKVHNIVGKKWPVGNEMWLKTHSLSLHTSKVGFKSFKVVYSSFYFSSKFKKRCMKIYVFAC